MTRTEIIRELCDEHPVTLADGRTLRVKIEPDDSNPFDEVDVYGRVEFVKRDRDRGNDAERPRGFNGAAEKLSAGRGDVVWWQPPADVKRTDAGFAGLRRLVLELLEFGMVGVILEVCDGTDAYGRPIVVKVASLWGIEPDPGDYLAEIIGDLLAELEITTEEAA